MLCSIYLPSSNFDSPCAMFGKLACEITFDPRDIDDDSYAALPSVRSISLRRISSRSSVLISIFHSTSLLAFASKETLLGRVMKYTTQPPFHFHPKLTSSLIIHRLAFLLFLFFFMLNPNHLPLITSFHYSPLSPLLFFLFLTLNSYRPSILIYSLLLLKLAILIL